MTIRNKVLHGNITDTQAMHIVEEEGFLFYLGAEKTKIPFFLTGKYEFIDETTKFLTKAEITIQKLIDKILLMIRPKMRKPVREILIEGSIGFVKTTNGIEFVTEQIW